MSPETTTSSVPAGARSASARASGAWDIVTKGARHAGLGERHEQLPGARPPRHPVDDPLDDLVHRQVDDPLHGQVQPGRLQAAGLDLPV
ncbi:hypothetical protein, partial [Micrococcus luteus]|uniref:hypothetical protein n=1 Tax=Micrococcus luteus TaxID=1270 RepID=UPI001F0EB49E